MRAALGCLVVFSVGAAQAALPPTYALDRGDILADAGNERAREHIDCASPAGIAVRGSDVYVACGDERLTYTTAADVMHPILVDRQRTPCSELDEQGACSVSETPLAEATIDEPLVSMPVTRRERRTALGAVIIGISLGSALVLEGSAFMGRVVGTFCESSTCAYSNASTGLDIASVIVAIGGTIAGIAVAATWHNVTSKTTMLAPSIQVSPSGGMIGLRFVF